MKINPTALSISQLLGARNEQYTIPAYQRRYSWRESEIWDLVDDILQIEDGDTHLLGSIVCLTAHHKAGLNGLEVVDGQQRLTTVAILLECVRQRLIQEEITGSVAELSVLLHAVLPKGPPLPKLLLDTIDADEYLRLVRGELEPEFQNVRLAHAFKIIREWISDESIEEVVSFDYKLRNQAIVIRLDVSEAKDAFKLFETINNRGLKLSQSDIIKNFLLGNAARFGESSLNLAKRSWADLIVHLADVNSDVFFRYYLMALKKMPIRASYVVDEFKEVFMTQVVEAETLPELRHYIEDDDGEEDVLEGLSATQIEQPKKASVRKTTFSNFLKKLVKSAEAYSQVALAKTTVKSVDRHLRNLQKIKSVQSYGFLMHLQMGGCTEKNFREILKITESFLLRRHICRERANETEPLFARLCEVDPTNPIQETRSAYRNLCPADDKFLSEFGSAIFPANIMNRARYCLEKIELSKHGKHEELQILGADDVHVEHIIPQKIKTKRVREEFGDWVKYLGDGAEEKHQKYVSRIGNLTLFAGDLNIGASNNPFSRKKSAYKKSAILMTQELSELGNFKFKNVDQRSHELASLAVKLWPRP